jgi:hypothetical protein
MVLICLRKQLKTQRQVLQETVDRGKYGAVSFHTRKQGTAFDLFAILGE